jgi:hypothetical protein
MKISESRKKFLVHYDQWKASGLSRAEFCKREGLKYSWFMSHQKQELRKEKEQAIGGKGFSRLYRHQSGQVKIEVKPEEKTIGSTVEFHYPDGRYFVFGPGTAVGLIRELVS